MCIAVPRVRLVLRTDIPIQALVPLKGIVLAGKVDVVVVVRQAVIGVGAGVQLENVLSNRIDLALAEYVRLTIASQWLSGVGGVWLVENDWLGRCQVRIQKFREVSLPHQGCGNSRDIRTADRNSICLKISEIKQLVAPDGKAQGRAELVLVIRRGG